MRTSIRNNRGSTTILMALLAAVILTLGLSFNWLVREHLRTSESIRQKAEAIVRTRSAFDALVYLLLTGSMNEKSLLIRQGGITTLQSIPLDGSEAALYEGVRIRVQDSNGSLSLSTPNAEALQRFFKQAGGDDGPVIADSLMDWLDLDDLSRINGAEAPYYSSQGLSYRPRNYALQYPEELLLIRGMNEEIYRRAMPSLTMLPNTGFNPNTAGIPTLKAFLNVDDVRAERIHDFARRGGIRSMPDLVALSGKMFDLQNYSNWFAPSGYVDVVVQTGAPRSLYTIRAGLTTGSGIFYPSFIHYWREE